MQVLLGSNSNASVNRQVVDYLMAQMPNKLTYLDLLQEAVPIYAKQLEEEGIPQYVQDLFAKIQATNEEILIVTPEYNGNLTPFFLNLIDWLSRIDKQIFRDKKVKVLSVTPGARKGQSVRQILATALPFLGATTVSTFGVGNFYQVFQNGEFVDQQVAQELLTFIQS